MSEYTLELNEVVDILTEQGKSLFDFDYALPDFMSKEDLQEHFIEHYFFREIGLETIPRFLQRLKVQWLEKVNEYDIKFKLVKNKLNVENAINTYEDNLEDSNTFNATPMSAMQEGRNYKTSVTEVKGKHNGYAIANSNVFKTINNVIVDHTEVINSFISEFDNLFMGVL